MPRPSRIATVMDEDWDGAYGGARDRAYKNSSDTGADNWPSMEATTGSFDAVQQRTSRSSRRRKSSSRSRRKDTAIPAVSPSTTATTTTTASSLWNSPAAETTGEPPSSSIPDSYIHVISSAFGPGADLYRDVLCVSPHASSREVRIAYFRRGRQVLSESPASNQKMANATISAAISDMAKLRFQAVSMAYEIISTPTWLEEYQEIAAEKSVASTPLLRTASSRESKKSEGVRWNEEVEELVFDQDPTEVSRSQKKKKKKKRIAVEAENLEKHLEQLDKEASLNFVDDFLDDLEQSIDNFLNFAGDDDDDASGGGGGSDVSLQEGTMPGNHDTPPQVPMEIAPKRKKKKKKKNKERRSSTGSAERHVTKSKEHRARSRSSSAERHVTKSKEHRTTRSRSSSSERHVTTEVPKKRTSRSRSAERPVTPPDVIAKKRSSRMEQHAIDQELEPTAEVLPKPHKSVGHETTDKAPEQDDSWNHDELRQSPVYKQEQDVPQVSREQEPHAAWQEDEFRQQESPVVPSVDEDSFGAPVVPSVDEDSFGVQYPDEDAPPRHSVLPWGDTSMAGEEEEDDYERTPASPPQERGRENSAGMDPWVGASNTTNKQHNFGTPPPPPNEEQPVHKSPPPEPTTPEPAAPDENQAPVNNNSKAPPPSKEYTFKAPVDIEVKRTFEKSSDSETAYTVDDTVSTLSASVVNREVNRDLTNSRYNGNMERVQEELNTTSDAVVPEVGEDAKMTHSNSSNDWENSPYLFCSQWCDGETNAAINVDPDAHFSVYFMAYLKAITNDMMQLGHSVRTGTWGPSSLFDAMTISENDLDGMLGILETEMEGIPDEVAKEFQ